MDDLISCGFDAEQVIKGKTRRELEVLWGDASLRGVSVCARAKGLHADAERRKLVVTCAQCLPRKESKRAHEPSRAMTRQHSLPTITRHGTLPAAILPGFVHLEGGACTGRQHRLPEDSVDGLEQCT